MTSWQKHGVEVTAIARASDLTMCADDWPDGSSALARACTQGRLSLGLVFACGYQGVSGREKVKSK